jgi:hypothetical protein
MVTAKVFIQISGDDSFWAEAELDLEKLNPERPPHSFTGRFLRFIDMTQELAELKLQSNPTDGGSKQLFLFDRKEGYRLEMRTTDELSFEAKWSAINPNTGKPGFRR